MTDEQILQLAACYFYKQEEGWSVTEDARIIEFATEIKDRILDEIALKIWTL